MCPANTLDTAVDHHRRRSCDVHHCIAVDDVAQGINADQGCCIMIVQAPKYPEVQSSAEMPHIAARTQRCCQWQIVQAHFDSIRSCTRHCESSQRCLQVRSQTHERNGGKRRGHMGQRSDYKPSAACWFACCMSRDASAMTACAELNLVVMRASMAVI